jgi:hypothetical protein
MVRSCTNSVVMQTRMFISEHGCAVRSRAREPQIIRSPSCQRGISLIRRRCPAFYSPAPWESRTLRTPSPVRDDFVRDGHRARTPGDVGTGPAEADQRTFGHRGPRVGAARPRSPPLPDPGRPRCPTPTRSRPRPVPLATDRRRGEVGRVPAQCGGGSTGRRGWPDGRRRRVGGRDGAEAASDDCRCVMPLGI